MSAAAILAAALTVGGHVTETEYFSMRECVTAAQAQSRAGELFITCDGRPVPRAEVQQVALDADENRLAAARMPNPDACLAELRVAVTEQTHSVWCLSRIRFDGLIITDAAQGWTRD